MKRRTLLATAPVLLAPTFLRAANPVPVVEEITSPRGTPFFLVRSNTQDRIALNFTFEGGDVDDGLTGPQTARLSSSMLLEGSAGKSDDELIEEFRDFGGALGAEPGADRFSFQLSAPSAGMSGAVGVLNQVLRQPDFAEGRLARVREEAAQQAESALLRPSSQAFVAFSKALAQPNPYSNVLFPDPARLRLVTRDNLLAWQARTLVRRGFSGVLVGNLTTAEAGELIDRLLDGLPEGTMARSPVTVVAPSRPAAIVRVSADTGAQVEMVIGDFYKSNAGLPMLIEHTMLSAIFGEGQKSRMFRLARGKLKATYGLGLYRSEYDGAKILTVSGRVERGKADETVGAIQEAWRDFRAKGPTDEEVADSRASWLGYLQQLIFDHEQVASLVLSWARSSGETPSLVTILETFKQQKVGTVEGLASLFSPDPLAVIAG